MWRPRSSAPRPRWAEIAVHPVVDLRDERASREEEGTALESDETRAPPAPAGDGLHNTAF